MAKFGTILILFTLFTVLKAQKIRVIKSLDEKIRLKTFSMQTPPLVSKQLLRQIFENASRFLDAEKPTNTNSSKILLKSAGAENQNSSGTLRTFQSVSTPNAHNVHKLSKIALKATKTLLRMYQANYDQSGAYASQYSPNPYAAHDYPQNQAYAENYAYPSEYAQVSHAPYPNEQNQYEAYNVNANFNEYLEQYQAPDEYCPYMQKPYCESSYYYRTIDGSCNNLENTWWGMSETPFRRLLEAKYEDYVDEPRKYSVNGRPLPNPRLVAMKLHEPKEQYTQYTNYLPHFAQFVDHDISLTLQTSDEKGEGIKCFCGEKDPDCVNIPTPKEDKLNHDQRCQVTARSSSSFRKFNCNLGKREQLNGLTHWLDLSQVYGNKLDKHTELRAFKNGLLKSSAMKNVKHDYLPFDKEGKCPFIKEGKACFKAGDFRLNQNMPLLGVHTVFLREHNRLAGILAEMNQHWDDEKLFQETRRVCNAVYQHVIYNEFLPVFLGDEVADLYNIKSLNQGYFLKYNPKLYPNLINEFSTAAYRAGHTLVRGSMNKADLGLHAFQNSSLRDLVFETEGAFKKGGIDAMLRGTLVDGAGKFDGNINTYLNNHLFEGLLEDTPTKRFSLPSLNINRAREHGIQPYNEYRALCGMNYAKTFEDLYNIPKHVRQSLKDVYADVNDVDLFTGGVNERPIEGAVVGATFACIIAKQFQDLKYGDRYFYENGHDEYIRFTPEQMYEIRKTSMSRILCDNSEFKRIQKNAFLKDHHQTNPYLDCENVPEMSYEPWREQQPVYYAYNYNYN